jgi:peptidyl-prolyl cis-trans isomerase SurA
LDSIRREILNGTLTLPQAVKQFSMDDASKGNGGILRNPNTGNNSFTAAEMGPEQFFIVEKLAPGEISPVQAYEEGNKQGFRILVLKSKTKQHQANLKEDYARISAAALAQKKQKTLEQWLSKNLKTCFIHIDASVAQLPGLSFFNKAK